MESYNGKKILVVGLGRSGRAAAELLHARGASVYCTDITASEKMAQMTAQLTERGIKVELGQHTLKFYRECELVVVSPGVPDNASPIIWADKNQIPVISEMELGFHEYKGKVVAVTGTNGKSTVTAMINRVLNHGGIKSKTAGNYGTPLSARIMQGAEAEVMVAETSSYQLERIVDFKPFVSLILNITPDHLDRYISMEGYSAAKMRIFENQTEEDFVIVNENLRNMIEPFRANSSTNFIFFGTKGDADVQYANGTITSMVKGRTTYDFRERFKLHGYHNIENLMAVVAVAELFNISAEQIYLALSAFEGLEHRLEYVDEIDSITFINDSKATNVDSAIKAVKSVDESVILIAGGKDKKFSFKPLAEAAKGKVRAVVLIGEAADRLARAFDSWVTVLKATTMDDAVEAAYEIADSGDTVLLSPACSSFDMFSGYEERGEVFRNSVKQLKMRLEHITGE